MFSKLGEMLGGIDPPTPFPSAYRLTSFGSANRHCGMVPSRKFLDQNPLNTLRKRVSFQMLYRQFFPLLNADRTSVSSLDDSQMLCGKLPEKQLEPAAKTSRFVSPFNIEAGIVP